MTEVPSAAATVLERLARRQPVLALGVRHARTPEIARIARAAGHHVLWVDLEHSAMPIDAAAQICATAHDLGLLALARVPERDHGSIGRLLDGGAHGIIAPRIETAAQAADIASACRFPPEGHRSAIAALPQAGYRRLPAAQLYAQVNRATVLKVLLESPQGIDNAEAIAATPGVDLVAIGANDLGAELGVPGDAKHPLLREAIGHALAACQRAGKPLVVGGIADAGETARWIEAGAATFLMAGIDTDILLAGVQARAQQALDLLSTTPGPARGPAAR